MEAINVDKYLTATELAWAEKVSAAIGKHIREKTEKGLSPRMFHAKMHGFVYAEFTVNPDLDEKYKVGIFAEEQTYPAWIRFSSSTDKPDIKKNTRGLAIKIINVKGPKLIESGPIKDSQDFLCVDVPTLSAGTYLVAVKAILALVGNIFNKLWFAFTHPGPIIKSLKNNPCYNLLETKYYSQAPSKFGTEVVKWGIFPRLEPASVLPEDPLPDYLRVRLSEHLQQDDAWFDFMVQFQENQDTEPVEDLSVLWKTQFHAVASIRIPRQHIIFDNLMRYGQKISYSPWHCIPEFMPLSGVNRVRAYVYNKMSIEREERNNARYNEPSIQSLLLARLIVDDPFYKSVLDASDKTTSDPTFNRIMALTPAPLADLEKQAEALEQRYLGEPYSVTTSKVYQNEFTTFTNIITTGTHNADLEKLLDEIGSAVAKNQHIRFDLLSMVHFCRWFIIDQAKDTNGKLLPPVLAFNIIYDGDLDTLLNKMFSHWATGLDLIYTHCEGYEALSSAADKKAWLIKNKNKKSVSWAAKVGGTVCMIRQEALLHDTIETLIQLKYGDKDSQKAKPADIYNYLTTYIDQHPSLEFARTPEPGPSFGKATLNVFRALANIFVVYLLLIPMLAPVLVFHLSWALLLISPLINAIVLAMIAELLENPFVKPPENKPLQDVLEKEDRLFQNQLTIYGTLKRPNLFHTNLLRLGLVLSSLTGRYKSTKGNLGGIATIHFLGWHIFNKGRNAMFLSNYDGGWESYLSEFIDYGGWVMNLNFGNIKGYPKIKFLFWSGAYNEQVFKTVVRDYQFPCQVWYSAYPLLSIRNILNNSKIRKGLTYHLNEKEIEEWLQLL